MESLKQLIYKKEIDGIDFAFEIESNPQRFDFGQYTVTAHYVKHNTFGEADIDTNKIKDICNCTLKAETLKDVFQYEEMVKATAQAVNYGNWTSVVNQVAMILNATLDYDEIQLIAQECVTELDGEHLLTTLEYCAEKTNRIWQYENESDLIRFVVQIFICDWLQSLNGIRRCLGKRINFNEITPTYDVIENWNFRDAIADGKQLYDINHNGGDSDE